MLFKGFLWPGLRDGSITVAFRRWKRPTVKVGGTLKSPGGLLSIDAVDEITERDITAADVHAAGFESLEAMLKLLSPEGTLYRVRFHRVGDDPRLALRANASLSDDEVADMRKRLGRMPFAESFLRLIQANPAVVSTELAPQVGLERPDFKLKVRRLKALGLTESLEVGYRLSPRGEAVLRAIFDS